jgi:hypothetical protein
MTGELNVAESATVNRDFKESTPTDGSMENHEKSNAASQVQDL